MSVCFMSNFGGPLFRLVSKNRFIYQQHIKHWFIWIFILRNIYIFFQMNLRTINRATARINVMVDSPDVFQWQATSRLPPTEVRSDWTLAWYRWYDSHKTNTFRRAEILASRWRRWLRLAPQWIYHQTNWGRAESKSPEWYKQGGHGPPVKNNPRAMIDGWGDG